MGTISLNRLGYYSELARDYTFSRCYLFFYRSTKKKTINVLQSFQDKALPCRNALKGVIGES